MTCFTRTTIFIVPAPRYRARGPSSTLRAAARPVTCAVPVTNSRDVALVT